jgi:hypothetical protein
MIITFNLNFVKLTVTKQNIVYIYILYILIGRMNEYSVYCNF